MARICGGADFNRRDLMCSLIFRNGLVDRELALDPTELRFRSSIRVARKQKRPRGSSVLYRVYAGTRVCVHVRQCQYACSISDSYTTVAPKGRWKFNFNGVTQRAPSARGSLCQSFPSFPGERRRDATRIKREGTRGKIRSPAT